MRIAKQLLGDPYPSHAKHPACTLIGGKDGGEIRSQESPCLGYVQVVMLKGTCLRVKTFYRERTQRNPILEEINPGGE